MGLETSTYIAGLDQSFPPSGDPKSQGDDHLRLIKKVLQNTFPQATGPLYFPKGEATSTTLTLDVTDQLNVITVTTTAGDVSVVLPASGTLAAGWACEVVKVSSDVNAAVVTPASGSINSKVGSTASIRVGALFEPARFLWTGALWVCSKPGPMIGATMSWDATTIPFGCMLLDGSVYNSTTFAELFAVLATTTLRDKRGRVEVAAGTGSGLTARVNGTNYGAETVALGTANLPAQTPAGTLTGAVTANSLSMTTNSNQVGTGAGFVDIISGGSTPITINNTLAFAGTAFAGQIATPFGLLQPSIGVQKIIRAC